MSFTHQIKHVVTVESRQLQDDNSYSAAQITSLDETIAAGATTFSNFDVDVSEVESLVMLCDRDVAITINDDGSPDATINLKAGKMLVWTSDSYFTNPLGSVDVASFKATLAAGDDASLFISVTQDPTP